MRIFNWNVNGIRAISLKLSEEFGVPQALETLFKRQGADVVCLQETKTDGFAGLGLEITQIPGFDAFWAFSTTRRGHSGTVTYARKGLVKFAEAGFTDPEFVDEGRTVMTDLGDFVLFNVYFPNGGPDGIRLEHKMRFYAAFKKRCEELIAEGRQVVVTGDVNTAHKPIDIHDPKKFEKGTGFLPREREWIDSMLAAGFTDVFRHFNPTQRKAYTFWSQRERRRATNDGWRIDYFLVTRGLLDKHVEACAIHPDVQHSDHCPVTLDLRDLASPGTFPTPTIEYTPTQLRGAVKSSKPGKLLTDFFQKKDPSKRKSEETPPGPVKRGPGRPPKSQVEPTSGAGTGPASSARLPSPGPAVPKSLRSSPRSPLKGASVPPQESLSTSE